MAGRVGRGRRDGPDAEYFGEDRQRDLPGREHLSGCAPPEVLRRLVRSATTRQTNRLRDDASMVYLRWDGPETV